MSVIKKTTEKVESKDVNEGSEVTTEVKVESKTKIGKSVLFTGVCGACNEVVKSVKIDPVDGVRCPTCKQRVGN